MYRGRNYNILTAYTEATMQKICILILTCSLVACQSKRSAMELICTSSINCATCKVESRDEQSKRIAAYIAERLSNTEISNMWRAIPTAPDHERPTFLLREAKKAGLSECHLAKEWSKYF